MRHGRAGGQSVKRTLLIKLALAGIGICLLVIVGSFFTDPPKMTEPDPAQMFNPSGNFTKIAQRLTIRIDLDQKSDLLRPGMMVEVNIAIDDR